MKILEFEVPARLAHMKLAEISIVTSLRHPCVVRFPDAHVNAACAQGSVKGAQATA